MIELRLHSVDCIEDTDEWASDDPYILVVAGAVPAPANPTRLPMSDVVVYPFKNMDDDSRPPFGSIGHRFASFWGIGGVPANVADTHDAIFVVAMMENDEGDPHVVRGNVAAAAALSLGRSLNIARSGKVQLLVQDVDTARRTPSSGGSLFNNDDPIGDPQELRFSPEELRRAEGGEIVARTMVFAGDGGHYTVTFEAFNPEGESRDRGFVGTFNAGVPSRQLMAMKAFQHRASAAVEAGFAAGFPNFYEAVHGRDHVGGTILIKPSVVEWRDVALALLGNVALEDFEARVRATNVFAIQNGFVGGFPNFYHAEYGSGVVCGTILLNSDGAEWRDISLLELGSPALDDFEQRFRATQDYANRNGFVGGFPNLFHADKQIIDFQTGRRTQQTVCGTILLKPGTAEWRDVLLFRGPA